MNRNSPNNKQSSLILDLQDYMFTSPNMEKYAKHMIQVILIPKSSIKNIVKMGAKCEDYRGAKCEDFKLPQEKPKIIKKKETKYKPKQKDSLFWCFYILKNGFSIMRWKLIINILLSKKLKSLNILNF